MLVDPILSTKTQVEDKRSFETIYQQHRPRIYGVLVRLLGDQDEAEDVTQQVFLKLYHARSHQVPDDERRLISWLYRVALNEGYNNIRSKKRRSSWYDKLILLGGGRHTAPDSARIFERQETQRQVREILTGMKPQEAKLLLLRHAGFSYHELANILEIPHSSIGSFLTKARRKFAKKYQTIVVTKEQYI